MKQDIANQYMFKLNEMKLNEDLKIMYEIKNDFENSVSIQQKITEKEILSYCNPYSSK